MTDEYTIDSTDGFRRIYRVRDHLGNLRKGRFHTEQQALDWIEGQGVREVLGLENRAESERDTGGRWDPRWAFLDTLSGKPWDPGGDQRRADLADAERRRARLQEGVGK